MARQEFSKPIKDNLAEESGHRCSYPGCENVTGGPRSDGHVVNAGMACHIYPATDGKSGPRMKVKTERQIPDDYTASAENGIWMCNLHGSLVDKDDGRFSVETLQAYKARARGHQALRLFGTPEQRDFDLIPMTLNLDAPCLERNDVGRLTLNAEDREKVFNFVRDSGAGEIWSDDTAYVAGGWFIEVIQNGVSHGSAKGAVMSANAHSLELTVLDDEFTVEDLDLSTTPNGGFLQLEMLRTHHAAYVTVNSRRSAEGAGFILTSLQPSDGDPCVVTVGGNIRLSETQLGELDSCATVHIRLTDVMIASDQGSLLQAIQKASELNSWISIHCSPRQEQFVNHILKAANVELSKVTVLR